VIPLLDLDLPIEPAVGLGGFRIGAHISEYADLLAAREGGRDEVVGSWNMISRFGQIYDWSEKEFDRITTKLLSLGRRRKTGHAGSSDEDIIDIPPDGPPAIDVCIDVRDGRVISVSALAAYRGALFGGIRAGMTFVDAAQIEPRPYYDEVGDEVRVRECSGIALQFVEDDPFPEQVPQLTIVEIQAFDPAKVDGKWLSDL
jgi:hypothetical protein